MLATCSMHTEKGQRKIMQSASLGAYSSAEFTRSARKPEHTTQACSGRWLSAELATCDAATASLAIINNRSCAALAPRCSHGEDPRKAWSMMASCRLRQAASLPRTSASCVGEKRHLTRSERTSEVVASTSSHICIGMPGQVALQGTAARSIGMSLDLAKADDERV